MQYEEQRTKRSTAPEGPAETIGSLLAELEEKKERIRREMGGLAAIERQHQRGKLTARERVALLFDPGTFEEMGILAYQLGGDPAKTAADGVITGTGKINGRPACVVAYDFTVMAGSMGRSGGVKATRMREWALRHRIPLIWLVDSAGARIQEAANSLFAQTGDIFFEQVMMSGGGPPSVCGMGLDLPAPPMFRPFPTLCPW